MMLSIRFSLFVVLVLMSSISFAQTSGDCVQQEDSNTLDEIELGSSTQTNGNADQQDIEGCRESDEVVRSAEGLHHFEQIEKVLGREEFGKEVSRTGWRQKDRENKKTRREKFPEWIITILEYLEGMERDEARTLKVSQTLEVILWVLVIGLILLLIIKYRQQLGSVITRLRGSELDRELPSTLFGLDVEKSSLPSDIIQVVRQHWRDGDARQSIALLLRASLISLLHEHSCMFMSSNTESECIAQIDQQAPREVGAFMHSLVSVWQQLAYAHKLPTQAVFDDLCQNWQEVF